MGYGAERFANIRCVGHISVCSEEDGASSSCVSCETDVGFGSFGCAGYSGLVAGKHSTAAITTCDSKVADTIPLHIRECRRYDVQKNVLSIVEVVPVSVILVLFVYYLLERG